MAEPDIPSHRASFPQPAPACLFFLSLSQKSLRGSNHSLNQTRLSQETGTLNKKERKDRESHTSRGKEPPPHNTEHNAQGIKKKIHSHAILPPSIRTRSLSCHIPQLPRFPAHKSLQRKVLIKIPHRNHSPRENFHLQHLFRNLFRNLPNMFICIQFHVQFKKQFRNEKLKLISFPQTQSQHNHPRHTQKTILPTGTLYR